MRFTKSPLLNMLLLSDIYKYSHGEQIKQGTTTIYDTMVARSFKKTSKSIFSGPQYFLKEYFMNPPTIADAKEAIDIRESMVGPDTLGIFTKNVMSLAELGYIPLEIKAAPEGLLVDNGNVLLTMKNTLPNFAWVGGIFEDLVMFSWNMSSVATYSYKYLQVTNKYADETVGNRDHVPFTVHDFGFRGGSCPEASMTGGMAHLFNFLGTDNIPAVAGLKAYYNGGINKLPIGLSVPASEHSVMCSYGKEGELDAFKNMLRLYPSGIVSIVSDTINLWNVLTKFAIILKDDILKREGGFINKVVFRPDSGNPELIICGDPSATEGSPEYLGAIRLLDQVFGSTINAKGFKELNPKVGLIYGDAMYFERYEKVLANLKAMGYASNNLVIGVGGILLQQHNRDDLGFALKATYSVCDGKPQDLIKDPITDPGKKSHTGLVTLTRDLATRKYVTNQSVTEEEEKTGLLRTIFKDGKLIIDDTLDEIRKRVASN